MQEVPCKGFCHQSVVEVHDSCHEIPSPARGSVIWRKGICHARGSIQTVTVRSHARGSVMQEVLSSAARGSVSGVAVILVPCKGFCVHSMQEDLSPARGSVSNPCKVPTHLMQGVLPISCKRICLWSGSCKGFCHLVQEDLSHARGSTHLTQGVLSPDHCTSNGLSLG